MNINTATAFVNNVHHALLQTVHTVSMRVPGDYQQMKNFSFVLPFREQQMVVA
jgi:hypothetical protein